MVSPVSGKWMTIVLVAAGLGASLAGCGGDEDEGGSEAPAANVPISETDFRLDPSTLSIDQPGTVRFRVTNDGETVHALEVEAPGGEVETENIQPGKSATLVAELVEAGTFVMYCPVGNHRELGMEGKVEVAGGGEESGSEEGGSGGGY
jgi:plastocyanin